MKASELMAERAELFEQLTKVDDGLRLGLSVGFAPTRAAAQARELLGARREICVQMLAVGYFAPELPEAFKELLQAI